MKILHLLDHSLPLHSGYTFRSRNIFRCQQDVGLEPVVVTSPKHEENWKGEWAPEETLDGVRYYRTGTVGRSSLPFLRERQLMAALERRVAEVALRENPQVLHAHSPVLNALPALEVGKRLGIPVVYEIRAFWEDAAVDHGSYGEKGLRYRLVRGMETRACRRADRVVTICEGLREDLLQRGIPASKLTVVPNAVDVQEFQAVPRDPDLAREWGLDGSFVVGFLGSFYHYEGLDLLVQALARPAAAGEQRGCASARRLGGWDARRPAQRSRPEAASSPFTIHDSRFTDSHRSPLTAHVSRTSTPHSRLTIDDSRPSIASQPPSIKLLLVGGGPAEEALRRQVAELGLEDRVVFTGRLPHERMPATYALTDVLCFPRKSMRLTERVTPLKPLEAMALGKPVIASDVGGHRELIRDGETGRLFPAGSVEDLATAIETLATNPDVGAELANNARTWVAAERTWARNGEVYVSVYEAVNRKP